MKKNILNRVLFIFGFIIVFGACKAKKEIVPAPVVAVPVVIEDNTKRDKLLAIINSQIAFTTLSIRARADLAIANNSNEVSMNIRIRNNEAIWVSITAIAGLEVARALITPDSVKIINRLENVYIKKPFSYIYEYTNERINFLTLQSILIGNTVNELIVDSTELNIQGNQAHLKSILGSLIYNVHTNEQNKVVQTVLTENQSKQMLTVNYENFQAIAEQQIPHSVTMKSQAKNKNIQLDMQFTKVDINEVLDLPFRVPERFLIKK